MPPQTAEHKLVVQRVKELMTRRSADESYQQEYKKFVTYVIENDLRGGLEEYKYIHRESVDRYFDVDVVTRTFQNTGTGSRIIQALQWFNDNLENPKGSFKVSSPTVKEALRQQQENLKDTPATTNFKCPHNGIKDVLSERDKKIIVTFILGHRRDWGSLNTSFCWGNQAAIRGASTRKFCYTELYMTVGFGAAKEGPRACVLCLILRPGDMNKDRHTTDRMVGCYRHREWLLCAIGHLSLHVLNELRLDGDINFLHADKSEKADWWLKSLIAYETLSDESGPMKQVYEATGVEGCKLTHNRTYAVQLAGSEGLAPHQISCMTKHLLDKQNKSYQPEVDKEGCRVMAGFAKDEGYFVEREFLEPIWPIDDLIDMLLPNYRVWVSEHNSPDGDKSACCRRFLFEIIPYMVRVVVQDGIYLVRDFPEHVMSNYLKVCNARNAFLFKPLTNSNFVQTQIFGYGGWAVTARHEAVALLTSRRADEIKALNAASQAALATVHARNAVLENQIVHLTRALDRSNANERLMIQNQGLILGALNHLTAQVNANNAPLPPPPAAAAATATATADPPPPPPPRHPMQATRDAQREVRRVAVGLDAVSCLAGAPLQPPIHTLPNSWLAAITEWESLNLSQYLSVNTGLWGQAMKSRFNKFKSIHEEVVRHKQQGQSLEQSAGHLDLIRTSERGKVSLTEHLRRLRQGNPNVKKREVFTRDRDRSKVLETQRQKVLKRDRQRQQQQQQPARGGNGWQLVTRERESLAMRRSREVAERREVVERERYEQHRRQVQVQVQVQQPAPQPQPPHRMQQAIAHQVAEPIRRLDQGRRLRNLGETADVLKEDVIEQFKPVLEVESSEEEEEEEERVFETDYRALDAAGLSLLKTRVLNRNPLIRGQHETLVLELGSYSETHFWTIYDDILQLEHNCGKN
jgi:hypothetical protein